jgi:hypothetical protein
MTRITSKRWRRQRVTLLPLLALSLALAVGATGCSSSSPAASASTYSGAPGLQISGTSQGWSFHDGQTITVAMGANKVFTPNVRLIILECADPGGTTANLPSKFAACDENTVQGDSVIVQGNGSFSETSYAVYRLPSTTLGEGKTWQPVCNQAHPCVLYIGENQNDFTKPKVFSHPFVVTSNGTGGG